MKTAMFPERFCLLAVIAMIQFAALAQPSFSFSGYATTLPVYQGGSGQGDSETDPFFLNRARIRLRPTTDLSSSTRISLEYEITALYHEGDFLFSPSKVHIRRLSTFDPAPRFQQRLGKR